MKREISLRYRSEHPANGATFSVKRATGHTDRREFGVVAVVAFSGLRPGFVSAPAASAAASLGGVNDATHVRDAVRVFYVEKLQGIGFY